ncbi:MULTISPECIES: UDP-glucose/GDP-mannose dehydrogenase family protein [unclassified Thermoactinomyces]|uniref:UDP-glucose dehydrogenase family protein n=1 Tax=unclassified Thermoactinomyces TaxID=2634588 RepID=UPI0018DC6A07|nr:UDP-glucose/GDP-mannose dehydrogenase family protein [Thermoactinomyces sp. CICC 10523]MBH8608019.1 UDP-glucose/GDP-mannose dehydrogenase family protein [Thermoactinomyces sp. CICC 10521]
MRLGIIGCGYVGVVTAVCFAEIGHKIICLDCNEQKINDLKKGKLPFYEPGLDELLEENLEKGQIKFTNSLDECVSYGDIIFITVGTPSLPDGSLDVAQIELLAKQIGHLINGEKTIVIKSTVPVGTNRHVQEVISSSNSTPYRCSVVSCPEFLREGSAISDTFNMERVVIGTNEPYVAELIEQLYSPFSKNFVKTNWETAELIKLASNAFLATKISFINEIANISEKCGADVTKVALGIGLDSRIGMSYLQAGIGYGGSCLPKDTVATVKLAQTLGYDFEILKSAVNVNEKQMLKPVKLLLEVLEEPSLSGKLISVLGLTFKPNTSDIRNSPSLRIIKEILELGGTVNAYDPVAISEVKRIFPSLNYYVDIEEAIKGSDAVLILTAWDHIKKFDFSKIFALMNEPLIIDGRNVLDSKEMEKYKIAYYSIGRSALSTRCEKAKLRWTN